VTSAAPGPVLVREARVDDAPEVARLLALLGYPWPTDVVAQRLAAYLASGEQAFVATDAPDGSSPALAGVLTVHITPVLHRAGPVGRLTSLVVDEPARGRGVGRALVQAAEAHFVARGCVLAEVTSNQRRTDAHRFYERLGYALTSARFGKVLTPAG